MRVAVRAGPPRGDEVEHLSALGVEQRGALGAGDDDRLALGAVLGEGVPDIAPVARQHIRGKRAALLPSGFWIVVHAGSCQLAEVELGLDGPERRRRHLIEPGNLGDDFHLAVALDRGAIMRRLGPVHHHAGEREVRAA